MQVGADLVWEAICQRKARVVLTLQDNVGHCASVEMAPAEALHLARVLMGEMHGSSPDSWLVERLAGAERLWLTLSSTSRGMVRVSRIEIEDAVAEQVSLALTTAAVECCPEPSNVQALRRTLLKPLRAILRWGVLHTRQLPRQRKQWMNRFHRSMVVLYRTVASFDRSVPM